MQPGSPVLSYVVMGVVVALIFGLRLRRMSKARGARRLRLEFLWIMPAIMVASSLALLMQFPLQGWEWAWLILAFALGAGLGWVRGMLIPIEVEPQTHLLNTRTSPAALGFLLVLFALRFGARAFLVDEASTLHLSIALITDAFVVFASGLFGVSRVEMWLRARRLLAVARSERKDLAEVFS